MPLATAREALSPSPSAAGVSLNRRACRSASSRVATSNSPRIQLGQLAPADVLDSFKNTELQAASLFDVGYGTVWVEGGFTLTGDRRIAAVGFQKLDGDLPSGWPNPGGPCFGDSGGPILLQSGGVEYVVASIHQIHIKFNSDGKQDCTGDSQAQRLDLGSVLSFIQATIAWHGP